MSVLLEGKNCSGQTIIIIYIYHALINALSAHMIHINLNIIFYTHVEHSPIKINLHKVFYGNTHTAMNLNVHDTHTCGTLYPAHMHYIYIYILYTNANSFSLCPEITVMVDWA